MSKRNNSLIESTQDIESKRYGSSTGQIVNKYLEPDEQINQVSIRTRVKTNKKIITVHEVTTGNNRATFESTKPR